ncbi:MAG: hypothetical protein V4561_11065 [Bacteroidota bacterium]
MNTSITHFKYYLLKKLSIVLLLTLSLCVQSKAQVLSAANPTKKSKILPKLYAGVKFGANFSYLSGTNWENGIKSNIVGGAFGGVKGMGLGAQAEALFEQSDYTTGSGFFNLYKSYYNNVSDSLKKGTFRVNKLCLPILVQVRLAKVLWLQTGIQFYGIVNVKDNSGMIKDAKQLFRTGNTAGIIGATFHLGNADIGARALFDFQNLNNLYSTDVWRQYMIQAHVGIKLF